MYFVKYHLILLYRDKEVLLFKKDHLLTNTNTILICCHVYNIIENDIIIPGKNHIYGILYDCGAYIENIKRVKII